MKEKGSLYSSIVRYFRSDEGLKQREKDFHFAMRCNGYFLLEDGEWKFSSAEPLIEEFRGAHVSFFGPGRADNFFSGKRIDHRRFVPAFEQESVTDVIRKYREVDEDQAARIAFLFGGIVRYLEHQIPNTDEGAMQIANSVKFAARMTKLGEQKSGEAIASAMAMYIISGGSLKDDNHFTGQVYHMAEAVREDPIVPLETKDLGLSQVTRLRAFMDKIQGKKHYPVPDITEDEAALNGFPTVGAEFHFSPDASRKYPNLWQRLALLNISQYQKGSYVQLSRNDRDVIEVRMNPSVYPIAIATWEHMRQSRLLPELNQTFFTVTINRPTENFSWDIDKVLLNNLRALGMLSYAGMLENIPRMNKPEEIDFGQVYLGQTVKMHDGKYEFDGNWSGGEGLYGQLAIYAGFGDILPPLSYFLSMGLKKPRILNIDYILPLSKIRTLKDALATKPAARRYLFRTIQQRVETDERLNRAFQAGGRIGELLNPN